jgi:hypothetical protein
MLRRVLLIATFCSATIFLPQSSAQARQLCVENDTLTFSPPLTLGNQSGFVTQEWNNTCAGAPGLTPSTGSGVWGYSYFGNCGAVVITEGESVVVAGSAYVVLQFFGYARGLVMVPDSYCPMSTARGTGAVVVA